MRIILFFLLMVFFYSAIAQDCAGPNHSANIQDSWVSCNPTPNPNQNRGNTHWVMYDLGYVYGLGSTKFWNYNLTEETDKGMKNVVIDYSLDGINWIEVTSFQLDQASGNPDYDGIDGPHLGQIEARYILISAIDSWGGTCAGLSEVRFDVSKIVSTNETPHEDYEIIVHPNPANDHISIRSNWDIKEIILLSSTGREMNRTHFSEYIDISYLIDGVYILMFVSKENKIRTKRFIKHSP